jgi:hypothetical protein
MIAFIIFIIQFLFNSPISHKQKRILTPLTPNQVISILNDAHYSNYNKYPSKNRLANAWAQVAIENGQGKLIYNYNFGNIGAPKHTKHPYFVIAGSRFISHSSPLDGAKRYWTTLKDHCPYSLVFFDAGLPEKAAYQLYKCHYYGADPNYYAEQMRKLFFKGLKLNENK